MSGTTQERYYRDEDTNQVYKDNINLNLKLGGHFETKPEGDKWFPRYFSGIRTEDFLDQLDLSSDVKSPPLFVAPSPDGGLQWGLDTDDLNFDAVGLTDCCDNGVTHANCSSDTSAQSSPLFYKLEEMDQDFAIGEGTTMAAKLDAPWPEERLENLYGSSPDWLDRHGKENLVNDIFLDQSQKILQVLGQDTSQMSYISCPEFALTTDSELPSLSEGIEPYSTSRTGLTSSFNSLISSPEKLSKPSSTDSTPFLEPMSKPKLVHKRKRPASILEVLENEYHEQIIEEEHIICHHCQKGFMSIQSLAQHYEQFKVFKALKFKCPIYNCPFNIIGLNKKNNLRRHVISKHYNRQQKAILSEDPYEEKMIRSLVYFCNCQRVFYRRDSLKRHQRSFHKSD